MINLPRCGSCNFWRPQIPPGLSLGRCHRKPPSARSGWPSTSPHEWCGEWETNPDGEYGYENRWEPAQQTEPRFEDLDALARRLEDEAFPKRNREEFP